MHSGCAECCVFASGGMRMHGFDVLRFTCSVKDILIRFFEKCILRLISVVGLESFSCWCLHYWHQFCAIMEAEQIKQMILFITSEAKEKEHELHQKGDEEGATEKAKELSAEKPKTKDAFQKNKNSWKSPKPFSGRLLPTSIDWTSYQKDRKSWNR